MVLFAGLLACLTLWWLSKNRAGFGRRLRRAFGLASEALFGTSQTRMLGAVVILAAGFLLLRGNFVLAALLGLSGVWMVEGQAAMTARLRGLIKSRSDRERRYRTNLLEAHLRADGSLRTGRVIAGPGAGAWLDDMPVETVVEFLRLCHVSDVVAAALLEPYLDRRAPGWRVDAERDRHPRPRRPPNPGAMTQEEAYQILGLQRGATAEEIRSAHRSLMKRAHPDQGAVPSGRRASTRPGTGF
ncbi:J domain-containing protein [Methylobacterium sp. P31]